MQDEQLDYYEIIINILQIFGILWFRDNTICIL